jgi:hypothetical protein
MKGDIKMKKITGITILAFVLIITMLFAGCGEDPIQKDLLNYVNNEIPKIASLESDALDKYNSVTGDNYNTDEETYTALSDSIIPKYRNFITKLEEIKPQTPEVKALHELYIEAANNQYNAFVQLKAAIETQDTNMVSQANEKLDKGRKGLRDFQDKIAELAKKHNVEFK